MKKRAVYFNYLGSNLYPELNNLYYKTLFKRTCFSKTDKTGSKLEQNQSRTQLYANNPVPVNGNNNENFIIFEKFLRIIRKILKKLFSDKHRNVVNSY